MPKPSHRQTLIDTGLRVVLERGYCGASVRDIVGAAGVPQGSFTNHFRSKEAFGLEILDRYYEMVDRNMAATLLNDQLSPLGRLGKWFDLQMNYLNETKMRTGCLIGNLSLDGVESVAIRSRLRQIYKKIHRAIAICLQAAVARGELSALPDKPDEVARFLYASLHGAVLQSKVDRSDAPFRRFKRLAFSTILRSPPARISMSRSSKS